MDIKTLRSKLGLTQGQLAHRLGMGRATIARWESGKVKPSKLAQKAIERLMRHNRIRFEGGEKPNE